MIGFVKEWLAINKGRFKFPPIVTEEDATSLRLNFEGILTYICASIRMAGDEWSFELWAVVPEFENGCDILTNYDTVVASKAGRFYCRLCAEQDEHDFYDTREALLENHSLVPLVEWLNENFTVDNYLYCYELRGSFAAEIEKVEGLPTLKGDVDHEAYCKIVMG